MSRGAASPSWVIDTADVSALEMFLLRRMREHAAGDHASVFAGGGMDLRGLREWEPGDSMSDIDWAQSSIRNFSPLITRQFEQDSAATVMVAADASLSTRGGAPGAPLRGTLLRCLAVLGMSAAFAQDRFGMIAFGDAGRPLRALRPRAGKAHVMHCLSHYVSCSESGERGEGDLITQLEAHLRGNSLLVFLSDGLLAPIHELLERLAVLAGEHDVLVVLVDAREAFAVPPVNAGWVEVCDVETGETVTISRAAALAMRERIAEWQANVIERAQSRGVEVLIVDSDRFRMAEALAACFTRRRLRKLRG
jgi:uncharacterized protein (DUF58 family)